MFFTNKISRKYIQQEVSEMPFIIAVKGKVTSTNTLMKKAAREGAKEFSVLVASKQTAGRGRMGKSFHSPGETGIYMSILLRPEISINPLRITTDAAVCCARVFEKMAGETAEIKWVNDIYMRGRKVCGILTEGSCGCAVLGIGINVLPPKKGFPDDIKNRAGAIFEKKEPYLREKMIIEFLREFIAVYTKGRSEDILSEYKKRSMIIGKEITVLSGNSEEKATAISVADDYSLVIEKENGEICNLSSGDVSIKI